MLEAMWAITKLGFILVTLPITGLFVLLGAGDWENALFFAMIFLGGVGTAATAGTTFIQTGDGKMNLFRWWNYK